MASSMVTVFTGFALCRIRQENGVMSLKATFPNWMVSRANSPVLRHPREITGIQLQLAKHCRQAGIWVTCHQLRHTFACGMIAAGAPVTSVQKMLGHTSLRTTQLYVEVADRQVERDYHAGIQKVIENSSTSLEVSNG